MGICLAAPVAFLLLSTPRLTAQGLYYDELHQTPASFLRVGRAAYRFTLVAWRQIPLLNMPYSGAIKSLLYGEWMHWTGLPFSVLSWRLLGIGLVTIGLACFLLLSRKMLGWAGLSIFSLLFLSDTTLLLTTRHDWGPTALALSLRLVWLGLWMRSASRRTAGWPSAFLLGAIPAFLVYEKLNNVVLAIPLVGLFFCAPWARQRSSRLALAAGVVLGAIPLLIVNILEPAISVQEVLHGGGSPPAPALGAFLPQFLGLGAGSAVRKFILGLAAPRWWDHAAALLLGAALALVTARAFRNRGEERAKIVLTCVASYLLLGILTHLMPRPTWVHHWVVATPFQYLALALGLPTRTASSRAERTLARSGVVLALVLLSVQTAGLWRTERGLAQGAASASWDPEFTRVAHYVADHREEAVFVLADWGFATSIYAISNGTVTSPELFWSYTGESQLAELLARNPGKPFYVLTRGVGRPVDPSRTKAIRADAERLASRGRLPLESPLAGLRRIEIVKYANPF